MTTTATKIEYDFPVNDLYGMSSPAAAAYFVMRIQQDGVDAYIDNNGCPAVINGHLSNQPSPLIDHVRIVFSGLVRQAF